MKTQIQKIFNHFKVPLPQPKIVVAKPAYFLGNGHIVNSIKNKGDYFVVHGQNKSGQQREIQVHQDGSIKNYQGNDKLDGYVGGEMKAQIKNIFQHFNVPLPIAKNDPDNDNLLKM